MLNRAFSTIEFKTIDEEKRIIEGIATTPSVDRTGDVMEVAGAEFTLPIPLLWQHNPDAPIGHVIEAKVTPAGIKVKAQLTKVDEPGRLKDRLDEAWQTLKHGLVRGLSIGFKGIDVARIEGSFGLKYLKWMWLELSAVTIPANAQASITTLKAISSEQLTALGLNAAKTVRLIEPSALGNTSKGVKIKPKENFEMKTLAEQIAALENTKATKIAALDEVTKKSLETGETMDAEAKQAFDDLVAELKSLDDDLQRLKTLEGLMAKNAKPVTPAATAEEGSQQRQPAFHNVVIEQKLAPGIRCARVVRCMAHAYKQIAKGNIVSPVDIAKQWYKHDPLVANVLKANVAAGSTLSGNWAEDLIGDESKVFADFVEFLRPQTILGKFGTGGIPSLRNVPFRVALVSQVAGGSGYWVGEGKAKPLTSGDFNRTTMTPLKVANIVVLTDELVRDSSPSAETLMRDMLVAALKERLDLDFINPDKAAVSNTSPAGILNGVTAIPSSGNDADAIRADIAAVFGAFIDANNPPTSGVWIMSSKTALKLSLMMNPLGQPEFPGITMNGGTFAGLPVITSEYVTPNTTGDFVALINASDVYLSDEGGFNVDMSREASLEMSDAPAHNSTTPTAAQLVSLWQTNSVGLRAERTINWSRRRNEGVAWLSNVNWGAGS